MDTVIILHQFSSQATYFNDLEVTILLFECNLHFSWTGNNRHDIFKSVEELVCCFRRQIQQVFDLNLNHMQSNDVKIEVTNLWTSPVADVVAFVVVAGLCVFYSDGI